MLTMNNIQNIYFIELFIYFISFIQVKVLKKVKTRLSDWDLSFYYQEVTCEQ